MKNLIGSTSIYSRISKCWIIWAEKANLSHQDYNGTDIKRHPSPFCRKVTLKWLNAWCTVIGWESVRHKMHCPMCAVPGKTILIPWWNYQKSKDSTKITSRRQYLQTQLRINKVKIQNSPPPYRKAAMNAWLETDSRAVTKQSFSSILIADH